MIICYPFITLFYNSDDYKESNKIGWFDTKYLYYWDRYYGKVPYYFYYYFRTKLKYDFIPMETVSICKYNGYTDACIDGSIKSVNPNLRINWKCSDYLEKETKCNVTPSSKIVVVAPEHDGKAYVQYDIDHSPENAPECECKNWYVTIKKENVGNPVTQLLGCDSSDKNIELDPNSAYSPSYTIGAQLYSTRRIKQ